MTFLSILIALVIERAFPQYRLPREHLWFDSYCRRLTGTSFAQWLMSNPWGAVLTALPLVLVIAWLQITLDSLGAPFTLVFGTVVLLLSLGPRDLREDAEAFIAARDAGDNGRADTLAQSLCLSMSPETEPRRSLAVARAVVVLASRRLLAPLFWFVAFGPVGAATYRIVNLLVERQQQLGCPAELQARSEELRHIADWIPARLTAAGYAIAGNFDAVAHAWRALDTAAGTGPLNEAEKLLALTGLAALDTVSDEMQPSRHADGDFSEGEQHAPPVVEDALALVWRALILWVAVIGGGSLFAAMA